MNQTLKTILGLSGAVILITSGVLVLSPEEPLVFDYCGEIHTLETQEQYEDFRDKVFAELELRAEVEPCEFAVYTDLLRIEEETNS